ncbi:SIMPL domain-containing protein [Parvularcula lutaonensis]|uniref:SIMPL domain-containing protein n=1 Tax=Parvularcula lutaonensis TaxID=491923 RepID=A0ABV7MDR4_9PROT|nr:SIMPL domain-containing protein [Parvularcula lutaonensis]GGY53805.1 hypothetical protein GCM10007148_23930 [Parvularcula lutaonensis]
MPEADTRKLYVSVDEKVSVPADSFFIKVSVVGFGDTQDSTLIELTAQLDDLRAAIPALEGLTGFSIETDDISIVPRPDERCKEVFGYDADRVCAPGEYVATVSLDIKGQPALQAGNLMSLASEKVRGSVELMSFFASDKEAAEAAALTAVLAKARREADLIASTSGSRAGSILEIRPPNIDDYYLPEMRLNDMFAPVGAGTQRQYAIRTIPIDQPTVEVSKDLLIVFALEPVEPPSED